MSAAITIKPDQSAIILGATGLLGQALVKEARNRGLTLLTAARKHADVNLDATNRESLLKVLKDASPNLVINTIAKVSLDSCELNPGDAYLTNAAIVGNLSSFCLDQNIKLCHISTDHYFSGDNDRLHDENSKVLLLNEYAKTKYAGECFALTNPNSLVLRTNIVGLRNWSGSPTFVEWAIGELASKKPITMFEDVYTSSIDVKTFSKALFELISKGASGLINLASSECASKKEFITRLAIRLGFDLSNCKVGRVNTNFGVARGESLALDVSYAESILGYKLPNLDSVIESIACEYEVSK